MISNYIHYLSHYDYQFLDRHFLSDIILQLVRHYLSYKLSYREIEEIYAPRGINADHSTLKRWVIKYAIDHKKKNPVTFS